MEIKKGNMIKKWIIIKKTYANIEKFNTTIENENKGIMTC